MTNGTGGTYEPSKCSSCSRSENEVGTFTAGPGYYLCEECAEICKLIVAQIKTDYENFERKSAKTRFRSCDPASQSSRL
jgi:ATP-dependent protease Clp ATPase subunit